MRKLNDNSRGERCSKYLTCCVVIVVLLVFLIVTGCSQFEQRKAPYIPEELKQIVTLNLSFYPSKALWSPLNKTVFIADYQDNLIYIYKDNKQINKIGGLGFENDKFNRLTDIALSPTGKLLALDSFQKTIKRFDNNGMWLENYQLKSMQEPSIFDVAGNGTVYIYDKTLDEITIIDDRLEEVLNRFGKFYFTNPSLINAGRQILTVVDGKTTSLYDSHGQFISDYSGFWQIDRYENRFVIKGNALSTTLSNDETKTFLLPMSQQTTTFLMIKENYVVQIAGKTVIISEIIYRIDKQ